MNANLTIKALHDQYDCCYACLDEARTWFMSINGVLGVGVGPKQTNQIIEPDVPCLIIYVARKKSRTELASTDLLPKEFYGVKTDVVEVGARLVPAHNEMDARWLESSSKFQQKNVAG